jgi:ABC-2 type transport system permease protein
MRHTLSIARKELNVYFTTPLPYALFAVSTVFTGFFLIGVIQNFQRLSLAAMQFPQYLDSSFLNLTDLVVLPCIHQTGLLVAITAPFLSMRLIAEEKRQRTFELLMTAPIRPLDLVLGKYVSGVLILTMTLGCTFLAPLMLDKFAISVDGSSGIEWSTVRVAFLGLFLWACAAMAIGLFVSALTDSQAVAAIISLLALILLWSVGWMGQSAEAGVIQTVLSYMSAPNHLMGFVQGVIHLQDLTYFLSFVVLGLFLSHRAIEAQRWT